MLVLPSRSTFDAAEAAFADETRFGAFACDRALAPAVLDFDPVDLLRIVLDALFAVRLPVTSLFLVIMRLTVVHCERAEYGKRSADLLSVLFSNQKEATPAIILVKIEQL